MDYRLNLGAWNGVFAVPNDVVDKHLRLAGALQLKVLLWVLKNSGTPFQLADIAAALGASEGDVRDALQYWTQTGIFSSVDTAKETQLSPGTQAAASPFVPAEVASQPVAAAPAPAAPKMPRLRHAKPDPSYITARIQGSEEIRLLMEEAQTITGNVLSPAMTSLLLYICDDLGLPVEVVLMLLHYAKSIGKANTSYLESAARDWAQGNVFTVAAAEEKLRRLDESGRAWRRVENVVEIAHRSPSKRELVFAETWVLEWHCTDELLRLAYEICVDGIQKLDFKYMDSILRRWHEQGITTAAQAEQERRQKKERASKKPQTTYDIDDFERMNLQKLQGTPVSEDKP